VFVELTRDRPGLRLGREQQILHSTLLQTFAIKHHS